MKFKMPRKGDVYTLKNDFIINEYTLGWRFHYKNRIKNPHHYNGYNYIGSDITIPAECVFKVTKICFEYVQIIFPITLNKKLPYPSNTPTIKVNIGFNQLENIEL